MSGTSSSSSLSSSSSKQTKTVQLFPQGNDGILIIKGTNGVIPSITREPIVFDSKGIPTAFTRTNTETKLYAGNNYYISTNVKLGDKYVTFTNQDNSEITIKAPELEIIEADTDIITVNSNNGSIGTIIGKISNLYWAPKYIAQLDVDYNLVNLSLIANIINNNSRLSSIKTITFSLLPLVDIETNTINAPYNKMQTLSLSSSSLRAAKTLSPMAQSNYNESNEFTNTSSVEELQDYAYTINGNYTLSQYNVIPLWNKQLGVPEIGYVFVGKDKMFSGYDIDVDPNLYLPSGTILLMKDDLVYKEVQMSKPVANNLRLVVVSIPNVSVISDNTFKGEGALQTVSLKYNIQNNNTYDINVKIVMAVGNINVLTINQDQPQPTHDKARKELVWLINCGGNGVDTTFSAKFIIGNQ